MKNKLVTALLCLAAATALWLYVITVVSPNSSATYSGIKPTIQGEGTLNANGYMLLTDEFPEVKLTLKGNRVDLNKISSSDITIGIDVSDINKSGIHEVPLSQPTFQSSVSNNAFAILDKSHETVTVEVDRRETKTIPVEIAYEGSVPASYMADKNSPVLDHETVNISGPKKVVDKITTARIDVDLNGKIESIEDDFAITLCDKEGEPVDAKWITVSQDSVKLQLKISKVKELQLEVEVIEGGGATKNDIQLTQDITVIQVSGSDAALEGMKSLKVGTIDLSQVKKDETFKFVVELPEGVTNESGVTEVNVEVSFTNLETKTVVVTNIAKVIAADGMQVNLTTKRLEILLRGPKKVMKNITAENVAITVDFSGEQPGDAKVNAQIIVNVDGVGAVGTYPVAANIKRAG